MNLKQEIAEVLLDKELTKSQRSERLAKIASRFLRDPDSEMSMDEVFNHWNLTMVEVLEEHNLWAVH